MKKSVEIFLMFMICLFIFTLGAIRGFAEEESDKDAVEQTISDFYKSLIAAYNGDNAELPSLYMDMDEIQSRNVMTALECISYSQRYMEEVYKIKEEKREYQYTIEYLAGEPMKNAEYKVVISMQLEAGKSYPPFLSNEKQTFYLRKIDGLWKIYRHDWSGICIFEVSADQIYEFDKEKRKEQLDQIAGWGANTDTVEEAEENSELSDTGVEVSNEVSTEARRLPNLPSEVHDYNPVHAVSYAVDNATTTNSLFYNYADDGGDCTNFVSQCVAYGLHNGGNRQLSSSYYYTGLWKPAFNTTGGNKWNTTTSWVGVNEFWDFACSNQMFCGKRIWFAAVDTPSSGCVIQFNDGTRWRHSAILYSNGPLWMVAQHSPFNSMLLSNMVYSSIRNLVPMALYIN